LKARKLKMGASSKHAN